MSATLDAEALAGHPLPGLPVGSDKEDRGAVLIVGGETVMAGAAILAGVAGLRVGAGKLQICADGDGVAATAVSVPEARILLRRSRVRMGPMLQAAAGKASALVIGPGMDAVAHERRLALALLEAAPEIPVVIDAGALPDPETHRSFNRHSGGRTIVTPHAGEMAAMLGRDKDAIQADPLNAARDASAILQSVVVLKGATTFIVSPDGTAWRHEGGVAGLGTSGSGDVLAGVIGGLLARGAAPVVAAMWGVVLHAEAGAILAAKAPLGFLARDLLEVLPQALTRITRDAVR